MKRGARERRRHEGRGRREAATARRTAGDSAGRRRGGRPSAAAQCPARLLPRAPGGRGGQGAREKRRPSRAGRAGGAATRTERAGGELPPKTGPRVPADGAGQAPGRTATLPSEANQQGVGNQEVISRGKNLQRQGLGPPSTKPCYHLRGSSGPQNPDSVSKGFQPPGGTSLRDKGPGTVIISSTTDTSYPNPGKVKSKGMPGETEVGGGDTEISTSQLAITYK